MDEYPERSPGGGGRGHSRAGSRSVLVLLPEQRPGLTEVLQNPNHIQLFK